MTAEAKTAAVDWLSKAGEVISRFGEENDSLKAQLAKLQADNEDLGKECLRWQAAAESDLSRLLKGALDKAMTEVMVTPPGAFATLPAPTPVEVEPDYRVFFSEIKERVALALPSNRWYSPADVQGMIDMDLDGHLLVAALRALASDGRILRVNSSYRATKGTEVPASTPFDGHPEMTATVKAQTTTEVGEAVESLTDLSRKLFDAIRDNPGCDIGKIASISGQNRNGAYYRVKAMVKLGLIEEVKRKRKGPGQPSCFYRLADPGAPAPKVRKGTQKEARSALCRVLPDVGEFRGVPLPDGQGVADTLKAFDGLKPGVWLAHQDVIDRTVVGRTGMTVRRFVVRLWRLGLLDRRMETRGGHRVAVFRRNAAQTACLVSLSRPAALLFGLLPGAGDGATAVGLSVGLRELGFGAKVSELLVLLIEGGLCERVAGPPDGAMWVYTRSRGAEVALSTLAGGAIAERSALLAHEDVNISVLNGLQLAGVVEVAEDLYTLSSAWEAKING